MTSNNNSPVYIRYLSGAFLCAVAILALCSCSRQKQDADVPTVTAKPSPSRPTPDKPALTPEKPVVTPLASAHDLPNFHAVTPGLFRGAAPTLEGLQALRKMGIKTVIDLRIAPKTVAKERAHLDGMGLHFINLPMSGDPPTEAEIQTFLKTVADPGQQPVFVHCQHGADRTGTMVGIYREHVAHWPFDRTYKEMRQYGFNPHWKKLTATVHRFAPAESSR